MKDFSRTLNSFESNGSMVLTPESSVRFLTELDGLTRIVDELNRLFEENRKMIVVQGIHTPTAISQKVSELEKKLKKLRNHIKEIK